MAAVEEESFPRGGTSVKKSEHVKLKSGKEGDKDLFKTKSEDFGKTGKKRKSSEKKDTKVKKPRVETGPVFSPNAGQVELLTHKTICPGLLTLGVVREIHDYGLGLSLPNGLSGAVSITDISQTYTDQLEQLADDNSDQDVHSLHELFTVGQIVRCKVTEVKTIKNGKVSVKVSIKPSDINSVFKPSLLKTGLVLCGTVKSQEDHGYIIDLGVKGVKAFLSNDNAEKFIQTCNEGFSLKLGQYLHCAVEPSDHLGILAGESRSVHVSIDPSKVKACKVIESMKLPLSAVVPGLMVPGVVDKVLGEGLRVSFLSYRGGIHSTHLSKPTNKYEAQQKVKACVLFVHPTTKSVSLSLLPHLTSDPAKPCSPFRGVQLGDKVEDAEVTWATNRRGVGFRLSQDVAGFSVIKNLSDKKVTDVQTKFAIGRRHKCRVIGFDYVDGVAMVSLKKSVVDKDMTKLSDIPLGSVVECRVRALHEGGMSVQVADRMRGFVPSLHLADVPLQHPEKKFQEGDKLKCRVLQRNPGKSSLILTNKRSLVSSSLPIITSYQDVTRGMELEGFIASISDRGVLVVFYNKVKGWVRREDLGAEPVEYPEKVFYLGQVVRCRVHSVQPEQERMKLSFKLFSDLSPTKTKSLAPPPDFKIGKILECRVLRKKNFGLDVTMLPSECPAYLPMTHLSDSPTNRELLMAQFQPGDLISEVMYLAHTSYTLVTKKHSFLQASRGGHLVSDFSELQPGLQLPGTVKNIMDYGLFMEFPGAMIGLAPNKFVCDMRLTSIPSEFPIGTSVNAKVVEVKEDKQRFLVSLRLADCYDGNMETMIEMLRAQLQEKEEAALKIKSKRGKPSKQVLKAANMKLGDVVKVTIKEVGKHHVTCNLGNGLQGVCSVLIIPEQEVSEGDEMEAVVLDVNLRTPSVDLSLCQKLVHAVKNVKQNRFSMTREGQSLKGEIIAVKEDYVLAALKGHALGRFLYLPCRKHPNDVLLKRSLHLGQVRSVIVKSMEKDVAIGNWLEFEAAAGDSTLADQIYDISKPSHRLGSIANALVKAVHDLQINVVVKNSPGRVHISEVEGSDVIGSFPMTNYKKLVGQRISVKIVGFREIKSHRYLPISHKSAVKAVLECSTIARKLEKSGMQSGDTLKGDSYKVGETVLAYVDHFTSHHLWFAVSPTFRGTAHILNLSTKPKFLDKREAKFKPGQVCETTVINVTDNNCLELSLVGTTEKIQVGSLTRGIIVGQTKDGDALNVHLLDDCVGRVWLTDVMDRYTDQPFSLYKTGKCVVCRVVSMTTTSDEEEGSDGHKVCGLSLRPSRCKPGKASEVTDPEVRALSDLTLGQVLRGFVVKIISAGVLVSVGCGLTGLAVYEKVSRCYIEDPEAAFPMGKVVTAKILSIDPDKKKNIGLSFLEEDTGVPESLPDSVKKRKRFRKKSLDEEATDKSTDTEVGTDKSTAKARKRQSQADGPVPDVKRVKKEDSLKRKLSKAKGDIKREVSEEGRGDVDSGVDTDEEVIFKRSPGGSLPRLQLTSNFSWDADYITQQAPADQGEVTSDSEREDQSEQKTSRKTKKAKLKEKSREEKKLFELEREQLEGTQQPQTAEDFDRLVLQSPDSSLVWLRYVAHHLELTEIEKARAVVERALQTINFREEQEKVNVWVGYLNLENLYGTPESLAKVLGRAIQQTEPLGIYQQLVNIYIKSAKIEEAEKLYQTMVKRYSANKDVWVSFGMFHFKHDKMEAGRKLMQRSLQSLPKRDHVEMISKFAQLEFKFGESERGKTMFENILSSYPKRTDLWSVYIDMVTRLEQFDTTRQLFERVINSKLSVKKMKFFFKKYLDFETAHGTEASVLDVKQKALEYVDSKGALEEL